MVGPANAWQRSLLVPAERLRLSSAISTFTEHLAGRYAMGDELAVLVSEPRLRRRYAAAEVREPCFAREPPVSSRTACTRLTFR